VSGEDVVVAVEGGVVELLDDVVEGGDVVEFVVVVDVGLIELCFVFFGVEPFDGGEQSGAGEGEAVGLVGGGVALAEAGEVEDFIFEVLEFFRHFNHEGVFVVFFIVVRVLWLENVGFFFVLNKGHLILVVPHELVGTAGFCLLQNFGEVVGEEGMGILWVDVQQVVDLG
jgi:hypothetical protein